MFCIFVAFCVLSSFFVMKITLVSLIFATNYRIDRLAAFLLLLTYYKNFTVGDSVVDEKKRVTEDGDMTRIKIHGPYISFDGCNEMV